MTPAAEDPIALFSTWLKEAEDAMGTEAAGAMSLATTDESGSPTVRMVLLCAFSAGGFVLYTNLGSAKSRHMQSNPRAALCFYWQPLNRQVRIEGHAESVSDEEADDYFRARPRKSQIGAWASRQSAPMADKDELARRVEEFTQKFSDQPIPRPPFWSGYRVIPDRIEFWIGKPFRLHERRLFIRRGEKWESEYLFP